MLSFLRPMILRTKPTPSCSGDSSRRRRHSNSKPPIRTRLSHSSLWPVADFGGTRLQQGGQRLPRSVLFDSFPTGREICFYGVGDSNEGLNNPDYSECHRVGASF